MQARTQKVDAESVLSRKAVLSSVVISQWTARKFDKRLTDDVHRKNNMADDAGRYNKMLIASNALEKVVQAVSRARAYHQRMTLPWMDEEGQRLLPSETYIEYANAMREHKAAFTTAVSEFCQNYPQYVAEARKRLNGSFVAADYPSTKEITSRFRFDVVILPCPVADFRCDIAKEQLSDIEADVEKRLTGALQAAQRRALERAARLIEPMIERLRAYKPAVEKGDKSEGVFRDTLVDNLREFIPLLRSFNFTEDAHIVRLADKMERDLCTIDAPDLREDENARKRVADAAEKILADVTGFMS